MARLTMFPSNMKVWGLPVTRSLCHGKPVIVANNSSLPEAGGSFADYFDTNDVDQLVEVAGRMIDDDDCATAVGKTSKNISFRDDGDSSPPI